ncbi:MAG: hypothetical protein II671_02285 [Salinivirgaceae bacterium]|nr:hypothetical protein [Salinivirgaceae bacterium]
MTLKRISLLIGALLVLTIGLAPVARAQYADGFDIPDSTYRALHKPNKATFMSSLVPGLGQYYNQKYWKIPIIYGGFTGLIYYASYNNYVYKKYRREYKWATDPDPNIQKKSKYPAANTERLKDTWRRYRDICFIGIGALYLLQVIDANVDAHFFDFTIDKDLSIKADPMIMPDFTEVAGSRTSTPLGVNITVTF